MNASLNKLVLLLIALLTGGLNQFGSLDVPQTKIPLKQAGRLFLIEATVDGQQGNFVFDTGATGLVLNKTYFRNYTRSRNNAAGISGTGSVSGYTQVGQLEVGGLIIPRVKADVANLGQIENQRQVRILGLIGMDILKNFELLIDLRTQSLELHEIDRKGNSLQPQIPPFHPDLICEVELRNNIMFVKGEVSGEAMDFCLDTGAESNVICSSCRKNVLSTVKINRRTTLTGVGGQSAEVLYGAMTDFALGEQKFAPMQTIVTSLAALSAAYDFPVDGVLGFDFFVRGKIRINLVKKELGIKFY